MMAFGVGVESKKKGEAIFGKNGVRSVKLVRGSGLVQWLWTMRGYHRPLFIFHVACRSGWLPAKPSVSVLQETD